MPTAIDLPQKPLPGDQIMQTAADWPQRPLRVFLIDDSRLIRERLIEEISRTRETEFVGYAESESEAVAQLKKLQCDAIVLDINLAQGSGFEVLRSVRADRTRRPRVIVYTGYAYPYYRRMTMELGADYFLDKATDFKLLLEIIEELPTTDGGAPH
jgi:DNA-binding NarL/FixJ family response regulator